MRLGSGYEISSQERITIVLHKASSIISLNASNWQFWLYSVFRMRSFFHGILHVSDLGCTLAKVGFFTVIKSRGCKQKSYVCNRFYDINNVIKTYLQKPRKKMVWFNANIYVQQLQEGNRLAKLHHKSNCIKSVNHWICVQWIKNTDIVSKI